MALYPRATEKISLVNDEEELRKRGYMLGSTLGEGSYAKVKSAFSESWNRKVALKIINRKKAPKDFQQKFLPRELEILKLVQHPNVIRLFEIMQFGGKVFIVMEMAGHGDLLEYIKLRGAIPEEKSRNMFQQLVNGLEYLHNVHVIHRDLKCENILLDAQNNIKISDFGFARILRPDDVSKTFCGSAAYAAPEILQGIPYSTTAYDIWSLGVILYIMVCGSMPYDDSNIKKMIKYQTERKVGFSRSKRLSHEVRELIHAMLEADAKARYTVSQVQDSTWLKKIRLVAPPVISTTSCVTPAPTMEGNLNPKGREIEKGPGNNTAHPIPPPGPAPGPGCESSRPATATEVPKSTAPPGVEHITTKIDRLGLT